MKANDLKNLSQKPVSLLRISPDEWSAIAETRRQGARFSLHFPHDVARSGQRGGLVLIATVGPDPALRLGLIASIAATSTFDSRVVFDLVSLAAPGSLARLLQGVTAPGCKHPVKAAGLLFYWLLGWRGCGGWFCLIILKAGRGRSRLPHLCLDEPLHG